MGCLQNRQSADYLVQCMPRALQYRTQWAVTSARRWHDVELASGVTFFHDSRRSFIRIWCQLEQAKNYTDEHNYYAFAYRLYVLQMTQATDTLHARAWAEFFQGRAPGESRGGLPVIFQIPGGGVLNRGFWSLRWSKWKNFLARALRCQWLPTPMITWSNSVKTCQLYQVLNQLDSLQ